jgi:hypothetical protein
VGAEKTLVAPIVVVVVVDVFVFFGPVAFVVGATTLRLSPVWTVTRAPGVTSLGS